MGVAQTLRDARAALLVDHAVNGKITARPKALKSDPMTPGFHNFLIQLSDDKTEWAVVALGTGALKRDLWFIFKDGDVVHARDGCKKEPPRHPIGPPVRLFVTAIPSLRDWRMPPGCVDDFHESAICPQLPPWQQKNHLILREGGLGLIVGLHTKDRSGRPGFVTQMQTDPYWMGVGCDGIIEIDHDNQNLASVLLLPVKAGTCHVLGKAQGMTIRQKVSVLPASSASPPGP